MMHLLECLKNCQTALVFTEAGVVVVVAVAVVSAIIKGLWHREPMDMVVPLQCRKRRRKHYKKKKSGTTSKKTRHHFKVRRGGRVVKRGRTVKHHKQRRINKRVKKSKNSRKAF